ncbi:hypothetical protein AB1Y20_013296 [Prymnesium parvum]|uniref:Uncharacterized protein n=1 Tax=Prymnesium parvum TaxID=97485 RepID=A0AB34ILB1_PRYPA
MLTLQSPSRLRASLVAAPQPSSRRSSRQHSLSPVDRRLSRQQSSSPNDRRLSRQPSLSPSRRSTCRQHTQPRGFSKHSPHSPSRRSPSPPKGRLVMECRRGAVSMHGAKAAWNAQKAGAGPAVAANFNIIVDLVQKGEALKLRSLLNSAPTLRSSLKGSSEPALHVAMGCRQSACAEVLLEMDANVNATSESGRTALHIAADNDFLAGMEILVRRRIKLDVQDGNGQTAALLAAGSHHPDAKKMFTLLIEAGADAALVDKTRSNVAHYASAANNVEILANMHSMHPAATRSSDREGCNPLHYASGAGAERTVDWLLDEAPELFVQKDASGTLPIVRAAQNERHGAVELMMRKGFWQPDDRIVDGLTLLMIAAQARLAPPPLAPRRRVRAAHVAAREQEADEELVRQLIDSGASHAAACDKGRTALMHAAVTDDAGCIQALLQAGADASAVDHEGYTALMYAACSCSAAAVAALLRMAGAEAAALLAKDRRGRTCLMQLMVLPSGGGVGGAAPRAAASPGRKKEQALEACWWGRGGGGAFTECCFSPQGAPHFRDSRAHERISAGPRGQARLLLNPAPPTPSAGEVTCPPSLRQITSRASSRRCVTTATSKARLLDTSHVPRDRVKRQHKPSVDLLKFGQDLSVESQLLEQTSEAMPQLGAERWCKQSDVAKICSLLLHEGGAAWGRRLLVESAIPHGNGPLEFAVGRRDELLLETLLSAQGEGELLLQHPDFQHRAASALRLAAIMGEHKMLAHLLLAGASVDARPEDLDSPAHAGCTALLLAAELGHVECLQLLLDARADTTLVDSREEDCALTLAAKCEQYECLATLLKYGADPEAADCEGLTALMSCAVHGASKSISLLLSAGASANRFNNHCTSALWYGACEGKEETVKLLLSSMEPGAQILNMRAASGHTPLSIAASSNYANVCSQLLEAHAELDSVSADGTTPLYHAAAGGHLETAKILIDQRADPRRKNIAGDSILDLAIQSQNEGMAALLIHAGAAFESLAATVRKCVGESRTDPPLVNALKLLLFGDMEEPQSSWSDSESETLDSSLLLLSSKTVLLAADRVRRTFGSDTVPEDLCIGAEEAEMMDDPQCEWVSAAARAPPEAGGPGRWWDVLAEEDQPVSWWYMLHGTLMLLELPRQQAAAGDVKVEYRMRKLDVHKDDEALARAALNASIREHLIEQARAMHWLVIHRPPTAYDCVMEACSGVAAATDALDEASQFLSTMKAHRWSPFVTEESQDWSSRHTPQSYRQLRVQTTSTKHVLRNLALRLRLQAAFAPSVQEKNDAQLNFASLRRELHRTFLKHMEALAHLEGTDAMGDTRQGTPTGRCTDAGMAARTNARLSLSAADDDLAKYHLLLSSHSSKSGSHRSAPASRRQSSGAGQNTLPRLVTAPRPAEGGRRSLREFTSAPGPEVDFDARQSAPQSRLPLPDRPPVEDGESERFVRICNELDAGHVIGYDDMHYLRKMVVRQPGLVIDKATTADAVEFSLESAAGVSQTLRCFVRTCIEHSSVVQCIGWIAQAEGVHASAADESGWLATHHLCDPARPELLCYYLGQTDPISIPAVINTENLEFKSAVGLLVRGSSPSQQRCLSQLLQVDLNLRFNV